jgi:hypothetical protein
VLCCLSFTFARLTLTHPALIDSTRLAWAASLDLLDKVGHDACVVEVPPLLKGVCSSGESPLKMVAHDT